MQWIEGKSQAGNRQLTRICGLLKQEVEQTSELLWVWRLSVEAQADGMWAGRTTILQGTSRSEKVAKMAVRMAAAGIKENAEGLEDDDA